MATLGSRVAADGSDIISATYIQTDGTPDGASQTFNVRGFNIDQGGVIATAKLGNVQVGNFSGNH